MSDYDPDEVIEPKFFEEWNKTHPLPVTLDPHPCLKCGQDMGRHHAYFDRQALPNEVEGQWEGVEVKGLFCPHPRPQRAKV